MDPKFEAMPVESGKIRREDESIASYGDTICPCTKSIKVIPAEESQIFQDGNVFKAELKIALGPEAERFLVFETPEATSENPVYVVWATDTVKGDVNNTDYNLYEEAAWTGDAAQPIININRVLAATVLPQTLLFSTVTAGVSLVGATEIDLDGVLGGQATGPQTSPAGGATAGLRFTGPLKPSTKHAIRLYNGDDTLTANIVVKSVFIEATLPDLYARVNP